MRSFSRSLRGKTSETAKRLKRHIIFLLGKTHIKCICSFIFAKYAKDVKTVTECVIVYFVYFPNQLTRNIFPSQRSFVKTFVWCRNPVNLSRLQSYLSRLISLPCLRSPSATHRESRVKAGDLKKTWGKLNHEAGFRLLYSTNRLLNVAPL